MSWCQNPSQYLPREMWSQVFLHVISSFTRARIPKGLLPFFFLFFPFSSLIHQTVAQVNPFALKQVNYPGFRLFCYFYSVQTSPEKPRFKVSISNLGVSVEWDKFTFKKSPLTTFAHLKVRHSRPPQPLRCKRKNSFPQLSSLYSYYPFMSLLRMIKSYNIYPLCEKCIFTIIKQCSTGTFPKV